MKKRDLTVSGMWYFNAHAQSPMHFFALSFLKVPTTCLRTAMAMARLCFCTRLCLSAGLPEPFLDAYVISTKGWLGVAKVSCILRHWGFQLILAYSLARPAILVVGKGRKGIFISSLSFLFLFLSCPYLLSPPLSLLFSPFHWATTQNDPQGLTGC